MLRCGADFLDSKDPHIDLDMQRSDDFVLNGCGQPGAHLGPVGPRWAPCWPHEPGYLGTVKNMVMQLFHSRLSQICARLTCYSILSFLCKS